MKLTPLLRFVVLIHVFAPLAILAGLPNRQTPSQQPATAGAPAAPAPAPQSRPESTPAASPSPSPGRPASKPGDEDVVRITTNLVQVDAVITDKNGKPVTDLKPEELRIFEDGRQQTITNFSYVIAETQPQPLTAKTEAADKTAVPAVPVRLRPDQVRRTIALVVDDLNLSFPSTNYVRQALRKFVDQQMQPGDLVAIIRTSSGIGALQQFTSDKRQLNAAIDRVKWYLNGRSGTSVFAPIEAAGLRNPMEQADNMQVRDAGEELNRFREDLFAVGTLGAVNYVVRGLKDLPGRKSVVLISDGFVIENINDPTSYYRAFDAVRRLIDQAGRASVVIYTINATGLQTLSLTAADNTTGLTGEEIEQKLTDRRTANFETQRALEYLALETGGIAIKNNNDLGGGIRRVMDDQKGYYLIGYRPDDSTFDRKTGRRTFHKLNLKVLRPGKYNVRMRHGFYGVSEEETKPGPLTAREQVLGALFSPFGSAGVHVRLTPLFANDAKLGSLTRSMLHVAASDLTFEDEPDGWHIATFDVLTVTFGDSGNVVDQVGRTHSLRVKGESYKRVLKDGFVYVVTFPIKKPGAYQMRAVVRDHGSQRVGSASQFIEVPDIKKNRLVVSSIVITGKDAAHKQTSGSPAGGNGATPDTQSEDEEVTDPTNSAAVRQFHVGTKMTYGFIVYNARLDKSGGQPQLQTQIRVFRDGKPVFTGKEQAVSTSSATDLKRLGAIGTLQLGSDLEPGEYVLQLIVTDLLADPKRRIASQWIDFEMVK